MSHINLSNAEIENIRQELKHWQAEDPKKRTFALVAKNTGYSPATISLFSSNSYTGDIESVASKIRNFLDLENSKLIQIDDKAKFVMTTAAKDATRAIQYAIAYRKLVLIQGDPGSGKSMTLSEYASNNTTSVLIEVDDTVTKTSLITDLCRKLKLPNDGTINEKFNSIISYLKSSNRVLIIDEGENLKTAELEVIRRIHDFTKVPVVLAGTKILEKKLCGRNFQLKQLSSRVGMNMKMDSLTENDAKLIIEANFPVAAKLSPMFYMLCKQNARNLENLIDLVRFAMVNSNCPITEDLIDECATMLLTQFN